MLAFVPNIETIEEGKSSIEYKENTRHALGYFNGINSLKIEAGTSKKIPVVFSKIPHKISLAVKWVHVSPAFHGYFLRDQKQGIKTLVFPFHSFW